MMVGWPFTLVSMILTIRAYLLLRFGLVYWFLPLAQQFVEAVEDWADCERKLMVVQSQEDKEGQVQRGRTPLAVTMAVVQMASIPVEEVEVQTVL
jgi:hypothetical protein